MDSGTRSTVTAAASLAGIAFIALLIGVPMMLNDVANLETELGHQRENFIELSNRMWKELMSQSEQTRLARDASNQAYRQRRQCMLIIYII